MRGRLNAFQAAMLRWRALYPYNAVHIAFVRAPCDLSRVAEAVTRQREAFGLTGLALDARRRRYEYRGGAPATRVEVIAAADDGPRAALLREIERQLNLAFPADGPLEPMRFFVVAEDDGFHLGLAYDHFIAGGDSIAVLLAAIVRRYRGEPYTGPPPDLYPPTFRRLLARHVGAFVRGMPAIRTVIASFRRGVRPRYTDDADGYNGFLSIELTPAQSAALFANAKRWGVTFNDVVTAAMMIVLARSVPNRGSQRQRSEVGIASIVNLRRECGLDTRAAFGQFLASMRVAHPVPVDIGLAALAQDVDRETRKIKSTRLYLQTLLAVRVNGIAWRFLDAPRRQRFYAKAFPVLGGLTTLNVDALWSAAGAPSPPDGYIRAVPTGPLAPLVVAATTATRAVRLGVTYRRAAFQPEHAARITADIAQCLTSGD
ncbi:MAG: hypothetical protein ABI812_08425 [Betaproteobacteria bacterium]